MTDKIKQWLDIEIGMNDNGPITVKERIAYLVICNGGYRFNQDITKYETKVIGPFSLGLSLPETVEHAYYIGMLSGMLILDVDPYEVLDSYVEEYLSNALPDIDVIGIMKDGVLDIERLFPSDADYMNPKHKGDDN